MRYVLLVQYDGTHFSGFQRQVNARTVQGELERAAAEIFKGKTRVAGSGRTDAGVHAFGQVCHLDAETTIPAERLRECFNALLPPDVKVIRSALAPEGFDCTRNTKKKTYVYTAYYSECDLPLLNRYSTRLKERPDVARMRRAAAMLEGEHDFKAFSSTGSSAKTSVRTVYEIKIETKAIPFGEQYKIRVTGNGFLYNMVRILAGELVSIGCGKGMDNIESAFASGERSLIAKTMPAAGLALERVDYGVPLFE